MTDKQRIFCDEYLTDLNATRAYKAAYPNVKKDSVASSNGNRLLRNAEIKEYIQKKACGKRGRSYRKARRSVEDTDADNAA